MSDRDKQFISKSGITGTQIANILQISKQAFYEGARNKKNYLDEKRLAQIYHYLISTNESSNIELANRILQAACDLDIELESEIEEQKNQGVKDYYCIFSETPLELEEQAYMEYIESDIYTRARLVAYFVDSSDVLDQLCLLLNQRIGRENSTFTSWRSNIFIIKTNLANALPHIALTRNQDGNWSGEVFSLKASPRKHEELDYRYVSRLLNILRFSGFGIGLKDDPMHFYSNKRSEYNGFEFILKDRWPKS